MTITVQIKNVYGNETIYPVCQNAKIFAALAGTKTLTLQAVAQIKLLGYAITVQPQVLA
jgi:predicted type IV restriction endonuclease